jgi:hypothetical protein
MFPLFNPQEGQPYRNGYGLDTMSCGSNWLSIVYDKDRNPSQLPFASPTREDAIRQAALHVDALIELRRRRR